MNSTDKLAKEWWLYVNSNSELWNFSEKDNISDYEFLLLVLDAFTVGTEEYYPKCNNVKCCKRSSDPLSLLQYHFTVKGCKSKILAYLTEDF